MKRVATMLALSLSPLLWGGCAGTAGQKMSPVRLQAINHNQRGVDAEARGDRDAALAEFSEALRLHGSIENTNGTVIALINMARTHRLKGNLPAARQAIDRASSLLQGSSDLAPELFFEKAKILLATGELPLAGEWAARAVAAENGPNLGRRINLVATILFRQRLSDRAREEAEKALKLNRDEGAVEEVANSLRLLGEIHLAQGRNDRATDCFGEALALDKELGLGRKIAADLRGLGIAALQKDDLPGAIGFLKRGVEVSLSGGDPVSAAEDMALLAETYRMGGELLPAGVVENEREKLLKAGGR